MSEEPRPTYVTSPWPGILIGSILAVASLPLVAVFVDRVFDPARADELGESLIQLAIAVAFAAFSSGCVTARHRVVVDGAAGSVTWTKSLFGVRWRTETWNRLDIEAVGSVATRSPHTWGRLWSIYVVGPRGRRPLEENASTASRAASWARQLGVPYHDGHTRTAPKPSKPLTVVGLIRSLLLIAVVIPGIFWLMFDRTALGYGAAFAGFLMLLATAVWFSDRIPADATVAAPKLKRSRFDWLGAVWLLSIPFGPLLGWLATEQLAAGNWQLMAGIRAFLCIGLPLIGVLPLLRSVRGKYALVASAILLVGTAFPVLMALGATYDLMRGPAWEAVTVAAARADGVVELSDGRILQTVSGANVRRGRMRLLVLRGLDRILDAQPGR